MELIDISRDLSEEDYGIIELIKNKKSIILINKIDLNEKWKTNEIFVNSQCFLSGLCSVCEKGYALSVPLLSISVDLSGAFLPL